MTLPYRPKTCSSACMMLLLVAIGGFTSNSLFAYSDPFLFAEHPIEFGGAGDRWFTGSPRDGYTCDVCHRGGETFPLRAKGLPKSGYKAGKKYQFEVQLPDDADHLAIIGEIVDASGSAAGTVSGEFEVEINVEDESEGDSELQTVDLEIFDVPESRSVFALGDYEAQSLTITWKAPRDPVGPVWLYMMGVVGDGSQDVNDDQVGRLVYRIDSQDGALPGTEDPGSRTNGFCTVHSTSGDSAPLANWITSLGLVGLMFRTKKKKPQIQKFPTHPFKSLSRSKFASFSILALFSLTNFACATVKPYERGRLAQPDMKLDGNADLLSGQRHATDYREGSSGGYGGGGGGCGCN